MTRILFLLAFALLAAPASICATKPVDLQRVALMRGQGMVMMRLILNRDIANGYPKFAQLTVLDAKTGKAHRMRDLYGHGRNGLYVASLPPGEYVADEVKAGDVSFWTAGMPSWTAGFFPTGAWRFIVEKGRMTNLGTILMVMPYTPFNSQRFRMVHVPDETLPQRSAHWFRPDDYPALLGSALSWKQVESHAGLDWMPIPSRRMSMALAGGTPARGGGLLFGEHYGQVAWRHPNGRWSWEDTGTIESILYVVDAADGVRYATAEGSMLLRRNGLRDWQRIPVPIADARPCLAYADADGSLLIAWEHSQKTEVMRYRPGAETPWSKEREFSTFAIFQGREQGLCKAMVTSRSLVFTNTSWGWSTSDRATDADIYDIATRTWKRQKFAMGGALGAFPNGDLHLMTGGIKKQTFNVSSDLGATWEPRGISDDLNSPAFADSQNGIAVGGTYNTTHTNILKRTTDGGHTWEKGVRVRGHVSFYRMMPDQELLFATSEGLFCSSRDYGRTAVLERDSTAENW